MRISLMLPFPTKCMRLLASRGRFGPYMQSGARPRGVETRFPDQTPVARCSRSVYRGGAGCKERGSDTPRRRGGSKKKRLWTLHHPNNCQNSLEFSSDRLGGPCHCIDVVESKIQYGDIYCEGHMTGQS